MNISEHRIVRYLVFDIITYELNYSVSEREIYAPVYAANRKLIEGLQQLYNTPVNICFQADPAFYQPVSYWYDEIQNVYYVPVNAANYAADGQVSTKWVQDVFIQTKTGVIHYNPDYMTRGLLMALNDTLGPDIVVRAGKPKQPDGGNIQYIDLDGQRFLVTGLRKNYAGETPDALRLPASTQPTKKKEVAIHIWNSEMDVAERQTFHLDLYFHFIGQVDTITQKKRDTEKPSVREILYLLAEPEVAFKADNELGVKQKLKKAIKAAGRSFSDKMPQPISKDKVYNYTEIPVPMLLFLDRSANGKGFYGMSYVNALIENTVNPVHDIRTVTISFPDFTEEILQLVHNENLVETKFLKSIPPNILLLIRLSYADELNAAGVKKQTAMLLQFYERFRENRVKETLAFMRKMHRRLVAAFAPYPEIDILFVRNRFANYAEHYGGLHCLVKPIYG